MTASLLIEPTEEERRNGWTAETLTAYVEERLVEQGAVVMTERKQLPRVQVRLKPNRSVH